MKSSRTLSSLRHLCSLGLPAEMLVPEFLATLDEAISTEVQNFVWHDQGLQPLKCFTNRPELLPHMERFQQFIADQRRRAQDWEAAKSSTFAGQPDSLAEKTIAYLENEVRRPLGVPHEAMCFLPNPSGTIYSVTLWRGGRRGYSEQEDALLKSAGAYLNYALSLPTPADALPMIEDGLCGAILLDVHGTLLQADEHARHLLALAADATAGRNFQQDEKLSALLRRLCRDLAHLTAGRIGSPPQQSLRNSWGLFAFRASWLQRPGPGDPGVVAVTVALHVPRKIKLWRAIHALRLPPRQQEVALLFAEGLTQNEIAARMSIARTTVIDHIRRLYDRLGIPADRDALRQHLLDTAT